MPPRRATTERTTSRQASTLGEIAGDGVHLVSRRRAASRPSRSRWPGQGRERRRCAPSAAKCAAMPLPMPEVDPVTSAILSVEGRHSG